MKSTLLILLVLIASLCAHAGDKQVLESTVIAPSVKVDLTPKALYTIADGQDEFGAGLALGFTFDALWGVEVEYDYLLDTERHLVTLAAFTLVPLGDQMVLKPFVGGGAWAADEVSPAVQGGVELLRDIGPATLSVGARYAWLDTSDPFTAFTAGLLWHF